MSNVKALADVIKWQKVDYDFQWHPIPVHSDVNVVVLSEGESLLPVSSDLFLYLCFIFSRLRVVILYILVIVFLSTLIH